MKTTRVFTLFALLLVVTSMTTLTSCKKIPDQVTISGIVTDIDGQPIEGVRVSVYDEPWFNGFGVVGKDWYTDESGYYRVERVFKRNNSLNHRRNQTIQNNQDFEIKSYFEKHLNSYSNHNYINNNFSNKNVSYEINNCNCNCSQKEYLINPNNYLKNNNNMYKIKKYNQINAPIRITDSLVIKPVIERKKYC